MTEAGDDIRARTAVIEHIAVFYAAIDDQDWSLVESLLSLDYRSSHPVAGDMVGRAVFIAGGKALGGRLAATQHMSTDYRVELDAGSAVVTCNCHAVHMFRSAEGRIEFANSGTQHRHQLEHDGQGWRIMATAAVPRWVAPRYHGLLRGELTAGDSL